MPTRRTALTLLAAIPAFPALAHHGWRWTDTGEFELTGIVTEARLGNPHGLLRVDAEGEVWTVEVGQPWRNERAGLSEDALRPGVEITVSGEPAADVSQRLLKAEKIWIGGVLHDLYPDRD